MNYAIVENETVVNIAVSVQPLKQNWYAIPADVPVMIGDTYDGKVFYSPEGGMRMNHVQIMTQNQVDQAHGQISELETAFDALMGGVSVALGL